jgi:citrate synthase
MNAAVSKTYMEELLPISLLALSGSYLGAAEVEASMRFLRRNRRRQPSELVDKLISDQGELQGGDEHLAPGFGSYFGGVDRMTTSVARAITALPGASRTLRWASEFTEAIGRYRMGWLPTGLAAAAFLDLGIHPRVGPGLFQLISAPGLLAHSSEMVAKPMTAMPFLPNSRYIDDTESGND